MLRLARPVRDPCQRRIATCIHRRRGGSPARDRFRRSAAGGVLPHFNGTRCHRLHGGSAPAVGDQTATSAHTHHHDVEDRARYPVEDRSTYHALIPSSVGLGLHNLTDGLTIGASAELSRAAATGVTVGILIHQLLVGISFAAVLGSHRASRATVVRSALLLAVAIPIGATAVLAAGTLSSDHLGVLLGAVGGALTYVATGNLLPEVQSEQPGWLIALTFAATLLLAVCWFTVIAPD